MKTALVLSFLGAFSSANGQPAGIPSDPRPLIGANLITNPGAEKVDGQNKLVGWTVSDATSDFVSSYGHTAGEWDFGCSAGCGLPPHAGSNYFRTAADLDDGQQHKSIRQQIDLSALHDTLAKQHFSFTMSAQMAGIRCDTPLTCAFGYVKVEFLDASGATIKAYSTKKSMNEFHRVDDSPDADTRMHKFQSIAFSGDVPATTRQAVVTLGSDQNCAGESGCSTAYVFFDDLALVLSVPPPGK